METLVERHMALADRLAYKKKKSLPRHIDIEDLKSAAYLGLVEAAGHYDESRGVQFTTFAYLRIWHAMDDQLRQFGPPMVSLDDSGDDQPLRDTIPAAEDDGVAFDEIVDVVAAGLDGQARQVLKMYFFDDMPMKEVGKEFGVSESRVSQLLAGYKREIRSRWSRGDLGAELAA